MSLSRYERKSDYLRLKLFKKWWQFSKAWMISVRSNLYLCQIWNSFNIGGFSVLIRVALNRTCEFYSKLCPFAKCGHKQTTPLMSQTNYRLYSQSGNEMLRPVYLNFKIATTFLCALVSCFDLGNKGLGLKLVPNPCGSRSENSLKVYQKSFIMFSIVFQIACKKKPTTFKRLQELIVTFLSILHLYCTGSKPGLN